MIGNLVRPASSRHLVVLGILVAIPLLATDAQAYIGPGAGFAVLGSFLVVLTK